MNQAQMNPIQIFRNSLQLLKNQNYPNSICTDNNSSNVKPSFNKEIINKFVQVDSNARQNPKILIITEQDQIFEQNIQSSQSKQYNPDILNSNLTNISFMPSKLLKQKCQSLENIKNYKQKYSSTGISINKQSNQVEKKQQESSIQFRDQIHWSVQKNDYSNDLQGSDQNQTIISQLMQLDSFHNFSSFYDSQKIIQRYKCKQQSQNISKSNEIKYKRPHSENQQIQQKIISNEKKENMILKKQSRIKKTQLNQKQIQNNELNQTEEKLEQKYETNVNQKQNTLTNQNQKLQNNKFECKNQKLNVNYKQILNIQNDENKYFTRDQRMKTLNNISSISKMNLNSSDYKNNEYSDIINNSSLISSTPLKDQNLNLPYIYLGELQPNSSIYDIEFGNEYKILEENDGSVQLGTWIAQKQQQQKGQNKRQLKKEYLVQKCRHNLSLIYCSICNRQVKSQI